jgi:aspartate/methionine/tyrosine aminotransferase
MRTSSSQTQPRSKADHDALEVKFGRLSTEYAPGQEVRHRLTNLDASARVPAAAAMDAVDFSHGDVDADAFPPAPGSVEAFVSGVHRGGVQAYTEYRGDAQLRHRLTQRLAAFTGRPVSADTELIITPGTQSALFLAVAATVTEGDKVAIVRPDYFANRKLVQFFGGEPVPVCLHYLEHGAYAGLDLGQLEDAFRAGAKTLVFSNPNNPTGFVYSAHEIAQIARLAYRYGAKVIVDQLYARLLYSGETYSHLRAAPIQPEHVITVMGPSKTESLSGYRLGVGFGSPQLIDRMEKLQAIVSLRAPGYCQAVLDTWFDEPPGWLHERIAAHQALRDELMTLMLGVDGLEVRAPQAGSYLFPRLPALSVGMHEFVRLLRQREAVTVTPGTEFDASADRSIRLNFSQNHASAVRGAERMARLIELYRA